MKPLQNISTIGKGTSISKAAMCSSTVQPTASGSAEDAATTNSASAKDSAKEAPTAVARGRQPEGAPARSSSQRIQPCNSCSKIHAANSNNRTDTRQTNTSLAVAKSGRNDEDRHGTKGFNTGSSMLTSITEHSRPSEGVTKQEHNSYKIHTIHSALHPPNLWTKSWG
ncbi:hypothetical protein Nepgr_013563 [Nepenthes gracilis]|uniref:Uncharacterized protein n=1 Tax=Nepenthes gracilis TaxID=150966 RepID=A0AAD3SIJ2_NEPGR|nr:hypothetical protein Nepgr_013563 [Nepenthes gracilis]